MSRKGFGCGHLGARGAVELEVLPALWGEREVLGPEGFVQLVERGEGHDLGLEEGQGGRVSGRRGH